MKQSFYKARFILFPIGAAAILALISFVVMQLWNNLLPVILHVGVITFWQAMGIFILCKLLFGFGGKGKPGWAREGSPWMRGKMEERFKNMSPEEKESFKAKMKDRMCNWGDHGLGRFGHRRPWDDFAAKEEKGE